MDAEIITILIANTTILAGSIISHSALWYRIGRIEQKLCNNKPRKKEGSTYIKRT